MDLPKVILKFIGDTFQVAGLKRMKPSIRKTIKEMQSLMKLTKVLLKFYNSTILPLQSLPPSGKKNVLRELPKVLINFQWDPLKAAALKCSKKAAND